jgi:hypothetical protein
MGKRMFLQLTANQLLHFIDSQFKWLLATALSVICLMVFLTELLIHS